MNRAETLALYAKGKTAWNAWAEKMLAERRAMERRGEWLLEEDELGLVEPANAPTRSWIEAATADFSHYDRSHAFDQKVNFFGWIFPHTTWFWSATFRDEALFQQATFYGQVWINKATFLKSASFENAVFLDIAWFQEAVFSDDARFNETEFSSAQFANTTFSDVARFGKAIFSGTARFTNATFKGAAFFHETQFSDFSEFNDVIFSDGAWFSKTQFSKDAGFERSTFSRATGFGEARFRRASFHGATFSATTWFDRAEFSDNARFDQATFAGYTSFENVGFHRKADFSGARSERAFSLAGAVFEDVPNFVQSHFVEAPRLDNVHLYPRKVERLRSPPYGGALLSGQDESAPARFRALKRLAVLGHDHEREIEFFAGEIKSARFVTDFPIVLSTWKRAEWPGVGRWWFGWAYQLVSNFGRSLLRPVALWLVTIMISTTYFLGQNPDVIAARERSVRQHWSLGIVTYTVASWSAWLNSQPCYAGMAASDGRPDARLTGLVEPVRMQTSAPTEALQLALRNAFVILDGGNDASHRTFGCLYGVERYGDNPIAIIPSNVSFTSALQKAVSAVLIFLFGLALRNMLRMK
jgi:uncharacterized protein YjbI with pentapeptide repeats